MSPFIPNLSQHIASLRDMAHKDAELKWTESHGAAFERTKTLICRQATQTESIVKVDAPSRELAAVLLQRGKPIDFASNSVSDCEQRYAKCWPLSSGVSGSTPTCLERRSRSSQIINGSR